MLPSSGYKTKSPYLLLDTLFSPTPLSLVFSLFGIAETSVKTLLNSVDLRFSNILSRLRATFHIAAIILFANVNYTHVLCARKNYATVEINPGERRK